MNNITRENLSGFFIGKNNFADMKKNVSLLSQTKTFRINPEKFIF